MSKLITSEMNVMTRDEARALYMARLTGPSHAIERARTLKLRVGIIRELTPGQSPRLVALRELELRKVRKTYAA